MNRTRVLTALTALGCVLSFAVGCGPAQIDINELPPKEAEEQATEHFVDAQAQLAERDAKGAWTEAQCRETAGHFEGSSKRFTRAGKRDEATSAKYNQAIVLSRCDLHDEAAAIHKALLREDKKYYRARVQLALHDFRNSADAAKAMAELQKAIDDSRFKSTEALTHLATLQMRSAESAAEHEEANLNLRRALATNDSFMPAYNQLAIFYLEQAKRKAGRQDASLNIAGHAPEKADTQALELAALVCSQALRKKPNYAPVHNTAGLISAELGNLSDAARSFGKARQLDAKFVEAHLNYAAVNLSFRGFKRAEEGYRAALELRPKDYDAHLGLALALRGQALGPSADKLITQSIAQLHKAKSLDPKRAEAYFNEAILVQEFKARGEGKTALTGLKDAKGLFNEFLSRAKDRPALTPAIGKARERMKDIDQIIDILESN